MERGSKRKESNPLLASDSENDRESPSLSDRNIIYSRDVIGTVQCLQLCWSAKIVTVEPLFFIYAFGVSFFVPVFQQYLYQSYGHARILNVTVEKYFCLNETFLDHVAGNGTNNEVQGESTRLVFYVTLADIITSVIAGLIIGPLTDWHGRKIALLLASFSSLLGSMLIICIVYFSLDLHFLILASFVSASLGGYLVMLMATLAYVVDVSTHKTRTLRIGVIQAVHNLAQTLAFITSGVWLQETDCDFRSLMWVIVACYSLSILYTIFMFPESLSHRQRTNRTAKSNSVAAIWHGLLLFFKPKLVTVKLWVGLLALCVAQVNLNGASVIGTYFFIHKPLNWDPELIGYFGSYNSILHGVMLTVGLPLALVIGCSDLLVCIVALLFSSGAYTFIGFVTTTWQMYVIAVVLSFEAIIIPTIRSILSKLVNQKEQGVLFAFVSSMEAVGIATGSAVYGNLYPTLFQQSYFLMAFLYLTPVLPLSFIFLVDHIKKRFTHMNSFNKSLHNLVTNEETT